jgi:hypothetical protein
VGKPKEYIKIHPLTISEDCETCIYIYSELGTSLAVSILEMGPQGRNFGGNTANGCPSMSVAPSSRGGMSLQDLVVYRGDTHCIIDACQYVTNLSLDRI